MKESSSTKETLKMKLVPGKPGRGYAPLHSEKTGGHTDERESYLFARETPEEKNIYPDKSTFNYDMETPVRAYI